MAKKKNAVDEELRQQKLQIAHDQEIRVAKLGVWLASTRYKEHGLNGTEALEFHLVQTHHWALAEIRALSAGDLFLLFAAEMTEFSRPPKGRRKRAGAS